MRVSEEPFVDDVVVPRVREERRDDDGVDASVKNQSVVQAMVAPFSLSSFWRSMQNAQAKEEFLRISAFCFHVSGSRLEMPPSSDNNRLVVLVPQATWPQITMDKCCVSELCGQVFNTTASRYDPGKWVFTCTVLSSM